MFIVMLSGLYKGFTIVSVCVSCLLQLDKRFSVYWYLGPYFLYSYRFYLTSSSRIVTQGGNVILFAQIAHILMIAVGVVFIII